MDKEVKGDKDIYEEFRLVSMWSELFFKLKPGEHIYIYESVRGNFHRPNPIRQPEEKLRHCIFVRYTKSKRILVKTDDDNKTPLIIDFLDWAGRKDSLPICAIPNNPDYVTNKMKKDMLEVLKNYEYGPCRKFGWMFKEKPHTKFLEFELVKGNELIEMSKQYNYNLNGLHIYRRKTDEYIHNPYKIIKEEIYAMPYNPEKVTLHTKARMYNAIKYLTDYEKSREYSFKKNLINN